MPMSLEPGERYPVVLTSDKDKEPRPTFWAVSQAMRGHSKIAKVLDRWSEDGVSVELVFSETVECLGTVIVDWANMGDLKYSKDAFYDLLSYTEARELLTKVMYNSHLEADEKKNSTSGDA